MAYSSDEEVPSSYAYLSDDTHGMPPIPRPTNFGYHRHLSQPEILNRTQLDGFSGHHPTHRSASTTSHYNNDIRSMSDSRVWQNEQFRLADTSSMYMTAGDRRRELHPDVYDSDYQQNRSSVLRTLFTPRQSEVEDLEQRHSALYILLHPRSETWYAEIFKRVLSTLIVIDLIAFVISTEAWMYDKYWIWFRAIEGVTASIFLIEYFARIFVCIENTKFGKYGNILGRLRWMCTFHAIIDVLATAPFFIFLISGWNMPNFTYLRIFRVLRIMKTDSYARAFSACYRVIYFNREILSVGVLICSFLVVGSSVLLYYFRPRMVDKDDDIPFQSIPSTLYLSILILTGQDSFIRSSEDMPWFTKCIIGLTGALSVAMYAIPVSLLTWGFEAEAERCARKVRAGIKHAKSMGNETDGHTIAKVGSMNSDDEYLKIIAKESSMSSASSLGNQDTKAQKVTQLTSAFLENDIDGRKFEALNAFLSANSDATSQTYLAAGGSVKDALLQRQQQRLDNLENSVSSIHSKLEHLCKLIEKQ